MFLKSKHLLLAALFLGAAPLGAGETPIVIPNAGFEDQLAGWTLGATDKQNGISAPREEAAHSGKYGLLIQDGFTNLGSYVTSSRFKIKPGCRYRYAFWGKLIEGSGGLAVFIRGFDANGKHGNPTPPNMDFQEVKDKSWKKYEGIYTPKIDAKEFDIYIRSYDKAVLKGALDDLTLSEIEEGSSGSALPKEMLGSDAAATSEKKIGPPNGGFESDAEQWSDRNDGGMSAVISEAAHQGSKGLRVTDEDTKKGSSFISKRMPVKSGAAYQLRFWGRVHSGGGLGIYVRFYDEAGKWLNENKDFIQLKTQKMNEWFSYDDFTVDSYEGSVSADIWIHTFGGSRIKADLDDFELVELTGDMSKTAFPGQYKISPADSSRLTAADIPGPDGIVYPDFRHAGVPGGIPELAVKSALQAASGEEIASRVETEMKKIGASGGGALLLPEGTFYLDRPILIAENNVVLRGAGREKTRLIFRYAIPKGEIRFPGLTAGSKIGPGQNVQAHASPERLKSISLEIDGKSVWSRQRGAHWGNSFSVWTTGSDLLAKAGVGTHRLRAAAEFETGERAEGSVEIELVAEEVDAGFPNNNMGAINFVGQKKMSGPKWKFVTDGRRGDTEIALEAGHGLENGSWFEIEAPATERWNKMVKNVSPYGSYRCNMYRAGKVSGARVAIPQALRLDFPVADGSYAAGLKPILRSGIEDLSIEQVENLWIHGVCFSVSAECWAKNVGVKNTGRHPVNFSRSKQGEMRGCRFEGAQFKGDGGSAYVGFEYDFDCLLDDVVAVGFRHGPNLNWAASGNVFRNSTFDGSDLQWHAGWANETLVENCVIRCDTNNGGYGYGAYTTAPEDSAHGPIGPRNVIYRCDFASPLDGLVLNGMNENYIVAHNRFTIEKGRAALIRVSSFDHIFKNNVFVFREALTPLFLLQSENCTGIEMIGNRFYGTRGPIIGGKAKTLVDQDNQCLAQPSAERPEAEVPSIFEWQRKNKPLASRGE